jgi:AcrR family transcriptional regulator
VVTASDAPVREPGTRARSGNAMARTRSALLEAAHACLAKYGIRKTTMVDVASSSGVAKATLYNHFRTKDDLLVALVEERVAALASVALSVTVAEGLSAGLGHAADLLAQDGALRRAAFEEPALLAPLARPSGARAWSLARDGVAAVLGAGGVTAGSAEVDLVLRWFTGQLLWPADASAALALAERLTGDGVAPAPVAQSPSLGWPTTTGS